MKSVLFSVKAEKDTVETISTAITVIEAIHVIYKST